MAGKTIRNLDDDVKTRLRVCAADNGRSMEEEARLILRAAVEAIPRGDFADRVLPFDSDAAREYADIAAARRPAGRVVPPADCRIAVIARNMPVATRNVRDFEDIEVPVVDPRTAA